MKKILYSFIALAILFSSCNIDRFPEWRQDEDDITPESFDAILNGCYAQIKGWSDVMHRVREYPADNVVIRGTSSDKFMSFITYLPVTDNYRLDAYWGNSLKVIQRTSTLINQTPIAGDDVMAKKVGEAYYLRGLCYFYMVNTFGRPYNQSPETNLGVPIINNYKPLEDDPKTLPDRSTVKQVYEQAVADMKQAAQLMDKGRGAPYASKGAAWAMLSRIYLYMGGTWDSPVNEFNDLAIKYADSVINSGQYKLLSYDNFKTYNTYSPADAAQTETIFAISYVAADYPTGYGGTIGAMYANINGVGWGEMYASEKYLQLLKQSTRGAKAKGGDVDARQNFIKPQYQTGTAGAITPAFRFVTEAFSKEGSNIAKSGYKYVQAALDTDASGNVIEPPQFTERGKTYILEHITELDYRVKNYDVYMTFDKVDTYCATGTYDGERDYLMRLNLNTYPEFYVYKCSQQSGTVHLYSPTISRLAEMYLNAAEAYIKKGDNASALPYLNEIHKRATKSEYTLAELSANAKKIAAEERQLEFAFEAHRTQDVFRNGETMYREYPGPHFPLRAYPPTSSRVVQYIPQNEINAYPVKLTQNEIDMNDHITLP